MMKVVFRSVVAEAQTSPRQLCLRTKTMTEDIDFSKPCMLGIDEAGRGPVLGPMVYAAAVCPLSLREELHALGADDSKALSPEQRDMLRAKIDNATFVRTEVEELSAEALSNQMLRRRKYNLNLISHDAALSLVERAIASGANVQEVYVDTVGPPEAYAKKFRNRFPTVSKVDVRKKADSVFRIVGAASIVAKTTRDRALSKWKCTQAKGVSDAKGSGYPGDPATKRWLRENLDPVFGFPDVVRFSWGTARVLLEKEAVDVEWCVRRMRRMRWSKRDMRTDLVIVARQGERRGGYCECQNHHRYHFVFWGETWKPPQGPQAQQRASSAWREISVDASLTKFTTARHAPLAAVL